MHYKSNNFNDDDKSARAVALAQHIIKTKDTVRKTATIFGISKSTVHKDVTTKLIQINHELYIKVQEVLEENKKDRHIRGGKATKEKYLACKNNNNNNNNNTNNKESLFAN